MKAEQLNVTGGLLGLSDDIKLAIISYTSTLSDIQNFVGSCSALHGLTTHPRFHTMVRQSVRSQDGDFLRIYETFHDLDKVAAITDDDSPISAVTFPPSSGDQHWFQEIQSFAFRPVYVESLGKLLSPVYYVTPGPHVHQSFLDFSNEISVDEAAQHYQPAPCPPSLELIKSVRGFTAAISTNGTVYGRGLTLDGRQTMDHSAEWIPLPFPLFPPALSRDPNDECLAVFELTDDSIYTISDKGTVVGFGDLSWMAPYLVNPSDDQLASACLSYSPRFRACNGENGKYGVFGDHKIVRMHPQHHVFIAEDGCFFIKNQQWYGPEDGEQLLCIPEQVVHACSYDSLLVLFAQTSTGCEILGAEMAENEHVDSFFTRAKQQLDKSKSAAEWEKGRNEVYQFRVTLPFEAREIRSTVATEKAIWILKIDGTLLILPLTAPGFDDCADDRNEFGSPTMEAMQKDEEGQNGQGNEDGRRENDTAYMWKISTEWKDVTAMVKKEAFPERENISEISIQSLFVNTDAVLVSFLL
ncbi:hypothetical protein BLNAU_6697 [Blattamonas nauphoetae]|uniref:F-box domain-containing protein n=1 Tax=Blattamonas nauphoetae TaxID=2049346 RepID=A0ABQ9Y3U5_9EUKA|nr:hypothetical protein BLNAU_6697 [Blattamonas nauphoetae]